MFRSRIFAAVFACSLLVSSGSWAASICVADPKLSGVSDCVISAKSGSGVLVGPVSTYGISSRNYLVSGGLDAWKEISITFSAKNVTMGGLLSGSATGTGSSKALRSAWPSLSTSSIVSGGELSRTITLSNFTNSAVDFSSYFISLIMNLRGKGTFMLSYDIKSVPLPPSVLMFASALMLFAGLAARKKTRGSI